MAKANNKKDLSKLSFEQAIKELTSIVDDIDQGQIELANSLAQYERGMSLIKHCRGILTKAEEKIERVTEKDD